ncbi:DUF2637 domain-containing protein [Streptomyces sp. NPDC005498]|uniref:DUF2637 domain-containing protein n=1 Tax=Streptomyces sp. NPDC005498 TaxID=3364717 RepID=UPI0036AE63CC
MTSPSPPNSDPHNGNDAKRPALSRLHWILIGIVVAGVVVIAAIGFSGSYTAVRKLAEDRGFGKFAPFFPIGIDAGIIVLLALDLLLTWMRIPFPLLRQTAWLLTAATIAFNGAAAWPDPLGTGMHAVIPLLFVVGVEAARHAVGRIADITADKHMDAVRFSRWVLAPYPTYRLWRRMKLWELRSYELVIKLEQDRMIYQARLQARYGRGWRRKAPVDSMTPLRLAKYGVPLADTGPAGLAAAGITTPVVFFADKSFTDADNARTTVDRAPSLSALADTDADTMSAHPALDADNTPQRPALSAASARMSAPAETPAEPVRADNGGHPHAVENPQDTAHFADELVRPSVPLRPLAPAAFANTSAPDNTATDNGADKNADNPTPDNTEADNKADNTPLVADNGADNHNAGNAGADKKLPRGAIADGVRAQLAVGVTDAAVITDRLSQALGLSVDKKTVARLVRREQAATPVPEPSTGPYL